MKAVGTIRSLSSSPRRRLPAPLRVAELRAHDADLRHGPPSARDRRGEAGGGVATVLPASR